MSSIRRILANRSNAKKSRGPRTLPGKARTRHNALRHGLSTIDRGNPVYADEIAAMAKAICAGDELPFVVEQAVVVAECQVLLRHVRAEKAAILEWFRDPTAAPPSRPHASTALAKARLRQADIAYEVLIWLRDAGEPGGAIASSANNNRRSRSSKPERLWEPVPERDEAEAISAAMPDLLRLARYERRAWSRRNRALRRLMELLSYPRGRGEEEGDRKQGRPPAVK
jgi:hypothetical protein